MIARFVFCLSLLALVTATCQAQPTASYTLTATKVLTAYVNDIVQGPTVATFDKRERLKSIATFKITNNSHDPMYVLVAGSMVQLDESGKVVAQYNAEKTIHKIESGKFLEFTDVGMEYRTGDDAADRYLGSLGYKISYDDRLGQKIPSGEEPVWLIGHGGWSNVFRLNKEDKHQPFQR